eukprot:GILJ01000389.1.p1 GENE.GILJ01000389.1~~GILJ01000389.1.p1  ORF type:complete len:224 (+),score=29.50 GILJ01000389.1:45-674(+)
MAFSIKLVLSLGLMVALASAATHPDFMNIRHMRVNSGSGVAVPAAKAKAAPILKPDSKPIERSLPEEDYPFVRAHYLRFDMTTTATDHSTSVTCRCCKNATDCSEKMIESSHFPDFIADDFDLNKCQKRAAWCFQALERELRSDSADRAETFVKLQDCRSSGKFQLQSKLLDSNGKEVDRMCMIDHFFQHLGFLVSRAEQAEIKADMNA